MANQYSRISDNADSLKIINNHLAILKNEISSQLAIVGTDKFKNIDALSLGSFNGDVYTETTDFLSTLQSYYRNKHQRWSNQLDSIKELLNDTPTGFELQKFLRNRNYNQTLTEMLEGKSMSTRIAENDGKLIQKIYPIYYRPNSANMFEISSQFYAPEKVVIHQPIGTLYVNAIVIILMTVLLMVSLYYDWLRKIMNWIEDFKLNRKYKKSAGN